MLDYPYDTPYFNQDEMEESEEYVCWLDLMGTKNNMKRSQKTTSIYIGKLHSIAIQESSDKEINIYPVMDGVFVTTDNQQELINYLTDVHASASATILEDQDYTFLIRSSVAYGPVKHGSTIDDQTCRVLANHDDYAEKLLFGIPMIQANELETKAPPFGVAIQQSARTFPTGDNRQFHGKWWEWWHRDTNTKNIASELYESLIRYFEKQSSNSIRYEYPQEKIKSHRERLTQYFVNDSTLPNGHTPDHFS